jgi:hypothetical protein
MGVKHKTSLFTNESAKFNLFLRAREIKHLTTALHQVTRLPKKQRDVWVEENGQFLADEFEDFISASNMTFEGLTIDEETVELSRNLVFSLKEALTTVQGMLHVPAELES